MPDIPVTVAACQLEKQLPSGFTTGQVLDAGGHDRRLASIRAAERALIAAGFALRRATYAPRPLLWVRITTKD